MPSVDWNETCTKTIQRYKPMYLLGDAYAYDLLDERLIPVAKCQLPDELLQLLGPESAGG
jgi:hypothetical protein